MTHVIRTRTLRQSTIKYARLSIEKKLRELEEEGKRLTAELSHLRKQCEHPPRSVSTETTPQGMPVYHCDDCGISWVDTADVF